MKTIGMLFATFLIGAVLAVPQTAGAASNAIGVNPRRDYTIKPGDTVQDTIFVTNLSKTEELTAKVEIIDFGSQNETGAPALLLKAKDPTKWSLEPYLTIAKEQKIAAGKSAEIPFTISIPANVGAGSYYSAIRFMAAGAPSDQNVSLTSSAVTLMFTRVTGSAKSSLSLEEFGAFTPNKDKTSGVYATFFSASEPKYLSYKLRNNGNVAEQPSGGILIKDMFGKEVQTIEKANPDNNLVLIEQTRRIDVCMNEQTRQVKNAETGNSEEQKNCDAPKLKPGLYKAQLGLVYGDNGENSQEIRTVASFWYLPAWFIIAVLVALAAIALGVRHLFNKAKGIGKKTYSSR